MGNLPPLREIYRWRGWSSEGYMEAVELECGHTKLVSAYRPPKRRTRCHECARDARVQARLRSQ